MSGVARQRGEARAEVLQQQTLLRRLTALATCLVATPIRRGAALRTAATIGFRADQPAPKGAADCGAAPHRPPRLTSLLNSRSMVGTRANAVPAGACPADIDGDGAVNVSDLVEVITNWGVCENCPADVNGDGAVDVSDLVEVITDWGPCS